MKTVSSLLALVALTVSARAGGIIDNTAEAAKLAVRRLPLILGLILAFKQLLTNFFPSNTPPSLHCDPSSTTNATPNSFVFFPSSRRARPWHLLHILSGLGGSA